MAVLVEAETLVVQRSFLDIFFPGGTEGYLQHCRSTGIDTRFAISDDYLAAVSSLDPFHLIRLTEVLQGRGAGGLYGGECLDFAFVDQRNGPTAPCSWLVFEVDEEGIAQVWNARTGEDDLVTPEGWTPRQSQELVVTGVEANRDHLLQISSEGGFDIWLDLTTGREIVIPRLPLVLDGDLNNPYLNLKPVLLDVAAEELRGRGFEYSRPANDSCLVVTHFDDKGNRLKLCIRTDEDRGHLLVLLRAPCMVPRRRRQEAAEFLTRANWGMVLGSLDMDWSDGEVIFRAGLAVADGTLTGGMVGELINTAFWTIRMYADGLERTIVGEHPEAVIVEIEG